eukprot:CAMPEP_0172331042 /NCGR_PEP_ID=MMETSP1058-20130122/61722_1 /TAXON_ID=83371 /ORGANISM="Detonula confervacea, Strain CCMP 353" /LENGTH=256 /DNA_ID=CAMNT_0013048295 /DNA_START=199 /DNA_END=969 /DNA_ORIENTATION=+
MGASADHRSSFARSLSSIHHLPRAEDPLTRLSPVCNNHDNTATLKRDRRVRSKRRSQNGIHMLNRRSISPTSSAITPSLSGNMPALPFSKDEQQSQRQESSQEYPARQQFHRRSTVITADKRRASVTFAPLHPSPSNACMENLVQAQDHQRGGLRQDYLLGEAIRSPSHMIIEPTPKRSIQAVNSLQKHDFAFIKRSDGSYSYAILACRSFEPIKGAKKNATTEECMIFVMDDTGSTKIIRQSRWSDSVHLVSMEA